MPASRGRNARRFRPTVSASRRTPIVTVAHDVGPAVVNIQTESTIRRREVDPFFDPFGVFGGRDRSYTSQSLGSGFVWSSEGIIVTNNHVVEGASRITVNFSDGTQVPAKLIGVDPDSDVAVLRVDAKNLLAAPIGTSSDLLIGETVIAVGNPFGLSGTVTTGVVSALGRSVPSKEAGRTFTDFIQTDASINPGNSGGPLLNIEGRVIGINTMIYANAQGIGFAIPVDRAKKVIQDILRYGQVHSAWIGAVTATITPEEARRTGLRASRGALVARVITGSPAQAAGLKPGDIITAVAGTSGRFARSVLDLHRDRRRRPAASADRRRATAPRNRSPFAPPTLRATSACAFSGRSPACASSTRAAPSSSTKSRAARAAKTSASRAATSSSASTAPRSRR